MVESINTLFAGVGISLLNRIAKYKQRPQNSLVLSRFFGPANYTSTPAVLMPGQGSAQIYGVTRQKPVKAFVRTNYHQYNFEGGFSPVGVDQAYVAAKAIDSTAGFTTTPNDETKALLDYIPFDLTTGINGSSVPGDLMGLFAQKMESHYIAVEEQIYRFFFKAIRANHNVKKDSDGYNPLGSSVTFDVDTGRTTVQQATDLSSTNTATFEAQARSLMKEINAAAGDMKKSQSQVPYVLLPSTAYDAYRSVLTFASQQTVYQGAQNTTLGDFGADPAAVYFMANGYVFVRIPDDYFETDTITPTTLMGEGVNPLVDPPYDRWLAYILPASSVHMFLSPATQEGFLNWRNKDVYTNSEVLNLMGQVGYLNPNTYNMLSSNDKSDRFIQHYINMQMGGMNEDYAFQAINATRIYLREVSPGAAPEALSVTVQARANLALLRTQPQYIQTWAIPKTKV